MKKTLLDSLEFSIVVETFNSKLEQEEMKIIRGSVTNMLDLHTFCEQRIECFLNLLSTTNPVLSEYKKDILKEKIEVYIAFAEAIYRIDRIKLENRRFYDKNHEYFMDGYEDIFTTSVFDNF
jgi:hypothetical protein